MYEVTKVECIKRNISSRVYQSGNISKLWSMSRSGMYKKSDQDTSRGYQSGGICQSRKRTVRQVFQSGMYQREVSTLYLLIDIIYEYLTSNINIILLSKAFKS